MKKYIKHLLLFIILVGIDQASKLWVRFNLQDGKKIDIIPDVLNIQFHDNAGAIWGILDGQINFLILFTFIVLSLILFLYFKVPDSRKHKLLKTIIVFIMAGAVGNLIDRIYLGYVVDFIYFEIIHFPLFNVADSYLTVSSILVLILSLFYYKDEDFAFLDQLFRRKKKAVETAGENKAENTDQDSIEEGIDKIHNSEDTVTDVSVDTNPSEGLIDLEKDNIDTTI